MINNRKYNSYNKDKILLEMSGMQSSSNNLKVSPMVKMNQHGVSWKAYLASKIACSNYYINQILMEGMD